MVPKPAQTKVVANARLPPLPKLRIKRPNEGTVNPCTTIMASLLACWASSGYSTTGCSAIEQQLRTCMDVSAGKTAKKNTINYHLGRMYPQIRGPRKRDT